MKRTESVTLAEIDRQRAAGWPDFHPEDYCHRCGRSNPSWATPDHEAWALATRDLDVGVVAILCPSCFVVLLGRAGGKDTTWHLVPDAAAPSPEETRDVED